ncbi:hypothetical protein L5515_006609 [Caenorhabditis briggsae]|uniref:Uncharacterized protein n=1 Tax=Caenorhabditis briggsae TaxID=6238 RepID=A0AAE9F2R1_CAEBR|nr:hypothetical protein L5515_006609 [Caenorhabditis briggsae]
MGLYSTGDGYADTDESFTNGTMPNLKSRFPLGMHPEDFVLIFISRETSSLGCQPVLPTHRNLFVLSLDYSVIARSIFIACGMVQIEMNVFFWLNVYYLMIAKPSTKISQRTQQLQKKLVKALFVQGIAAIDLFAIPIATVVYIMNVWYHNQAINNLVFVGLAFHGTASSLIMIFIHKPYRDFVLSPLVRRFIELNAPLNPCSFQTMIYRYMLHLFKSLCFFV